MNTPILGPDGKPIAGGVNTDGTHLTLVEKRDAAQIPAHEHFTTTGWPLGQRISFAPSPEPWLILRRDALQEMIAQGVRSSIAQMMNDSDPKIV